MVDAAKRFRIAAGVISFIKDTLMPQWRNKPTLPEDLPPELKRDCLIHLESLFLINAQRITIVVSRQKITFDSNSWPKSSPLFKVLVQLVKGLNEKLNDMSCITDQHLKDDESVFFGVLTDAILCQFLALDCFLKVESSNEAEKDCAKSVRFIDAASSSMQQAIRVYRSVKSSAKDYFLENLKPVLNELNQEIKEKSAEYHENNDKVYFGSVTDFDVAEQVRNVKSIFLPKIIEFQLPSVSPVSFERKAINKAPVTDSSQPPPSIEEATRIQNLSVNHNTTNANVGNTNPNINAQGIDQSVFNALPPDVQQEVLQQQQLQSQGENPRRGTTL